MAMPKWFEWVIIAMSAASILSALASGCLGLVSAPREWRSATRDGDPGRFWAFIAGCAIVTCALLADVLLR